MFGFGVVTGDTGPQLIVQRDGSMTALTSLLGDGLAPASILTMLPEWDTWVERVSQALDADPPVRWVDVADTVMEAPIAPATIYCAGTNFYDHVKEMKVPLPDKSSEPLVNFNVPATAVTGHRQLVHRPIGVERLDWEVELAAVISRRAWRVKAEDAMDYVAGYTTANDVSVRDATIFHDVFGVRWMFSKGQATMKPIGPTLIPRVFVPDPMNLALTLLVNGEVRQESNTSEMIWTLAEQIETYSFMTPLQPGDLLLTGTPAGTAAAHGQYLSDGDEMTASVGGIGTLVNRVAPPFGLMADADDLNRQLVRQVLVEHGLPTGSRLSLRSLSGGVSGEVVLVTIDDREALVIKRPRERLAVDAEWVIAQDRAFNEVACLEYLGSILPAGSVPEVRFVDRERYVLAMEVLPAPRVTWKEQLFDGNVSELTRHPGGRAARADSSTQ